MLKTINISHPTATIDLLQPEPVLEMVKGNSYELNITADGGWTAAFLFGKTNVGRILPDQHGKSVKYPWPAELQNDTYKLVLENRDKGTDKKEIRVKVVNVEAPVEGSEPTPKPHPNEEQPVLGSISGLTFNDPNANGVFDEGDSIGGGKEVVLMPVGTKVKSDAKGFFKFDNLPAGAYEVTRQFPAGYEISNPTAPGGRSIVVNLAVGEHKEWANIGSKNSKPVEQKPPVVKPPVVKPPVVTPPPTGKKPRKSIVSATYIKQDFQVNTPEGKVKWIDLLHKWNVTGTREWWSTNFNEPVSKTAFDKLRPWADAGLKPTIVFTFNSKKGMAVPTKAQASDYAKRVVDAANGFEFEWEVVNEPNHTNYYEGTVTQLVDQIVNPIYEVAHAAGIPVISPSVTYNVDYVKRMFEKGLLCDYVGFHPYRQSGAAAVKLHRELRAVIGDKEVECTEWNAFCGPNYRLYADPNNVRKTKAQGTLYATPAMNEDQVLKVIWDSYNGLVQEGGVRTLHYFIGVSQGWKHTTGPINLMNDTQDSDGNIISLETTRFANEFYALI